MKKLELYIHIPFCIRKCAYCDFLSFDASGEEAQSNYMDALFKEIAWYGEKLPDYEISTIYIGGGTPSVLAPEQILLLMQTVRDSFAVDDDAEISIECNPGTDPDPEVMRHKLSIYQVCGINRLSIGLQSSHNGELDILGRIHTFEQFLQTYQTAREVGYNNINVDIMSGIPYQTPEKFRQTLQWVVRLKPEHISAYSLIVEKGTPFYERYHNDVLRQEAGEPTEILPNEDAVCRMISDTNEMLGKHNYRRYEISNYSLPGYECRHNIGYWERAEYLGVGLGASSLLWNTRYENIRDFDEYIRGAGVIRQMTMIRKAPFVQTEPMMQERRSINWKTNIHASEFRLSRHEQM
ncbi:MAG: radical SAM family heme chaperone HemW, partial [Clostridiales bacterium]|nr:radical SAM family heme chaperone HemW [Clostridiales bacterium]